MNVPLVFCVLLSVNFGLAIPCIPPSNFSETNQNDLQYYLYREPGTTTYTELKYGQLAGVTYNSGCPFVVIAHGFSDHAFKPWILDAKDKIFQAYSCANVVIVDWSNITSTFNYTNVVTDMNLVYPLTSYKTCDAGKHVTKIITEMNSAWDVSFCDVLLMGHSLGAHLMGCAGKYVKENTESSFCHIIGMDPAGPYFNGADDTCRLGINDATFVQTVRTSVGTFGIVGPIGHVDYYVNGGQGQPGCPNAELPTPEICYHCYSYYVTPATFTTSGTGFDSRECSNYATYEQGNCDNNSLSQMGYYSRKDITGSYYLDTSSTFPYTKSGARRLGK